MTFLCTNTNVIFGQEGVKYKKIYFYLFQGFIGKITLQIPFYRPHSDPWVISMSQLNLIIGPAQLEEYDAEKEREEERARKKYLLKALEDKFKVGCSTRMDNSLVHLDSYRVTVGVL